MQIQFVDFNGADAAFGSTYQAQWNQIRDSLETVPLHLKNSDQAGKQGSLIFDPVGTNHAIKDQLQARQWAANVPVPAKFSFLGTDVDFVSGGVLVEVQFSNYPFLLNNSVRAELLFKSKVPMAGRPIAALVVVAKARMFPSSNSTLYYEQGVNQLTELARNSVLDIPIRLVGLFAGHGQQEAHHTEYHAARYSRTVVQRAAKRIRITPGTGRSRCSIRLD